jgi:LuxR family quorum-sensing system transcriptional regulator SolR
MDLLPEGFEALDSAQDASTLRCKVKVLCERLGFEQFAYALHIDLQLNRPIHHTFSSYPQAWVQRYVAGNYFTVDPVFTHAMGTPLPVVWREKHFLESQAMQLWEEARKFGIANGVSVAVRDRPGFKGVFSLARDGPLEVTGKDLSALIGDVQILACLVHAAVMRIEVPALVPQVTVDLTDRERECLRWAGDGKTAWEIGQILGISERTAVFHLNNSVGKLGATNKTQAIVNAISLGLLEFA